MFLKFPGRDIFQLPSSVGDPDMLKSTPQNYTLIAQIPKNIGLQEVYNPIYFPIS